MKVLIISHNPLSDQSNMGKTLLSLFSGFDRKELCQLYIYPSIPNDPSCGSFYRVTDKDALTACFGLRMIGGEVPQEKLGTAPGMFEDEKDVPIYRSPKNKSAIRRLLRDGIWRCARWDNERLRAWLTEQRPDRIFVAPGAAMFLYDFALKIARMQNIPIVTYLCDEYYFVREGKALAERLRLGLLRRKMEKLLHNSAHLLAISDPLRERYQQHFQIPATVVTTGAGIKRARQPVETAQPSQICYFGNVRCNRHASLEVIAQTLEEINRQMGTDYRLRIFTGEKDAGIRSRLSRFSSVRLEAFVTGADFENALCDAQVLLHTEAFDEESMDRVKHSISTKIADSLASGVPLLAYGPAGIASMDYLRQEGCALCITEPSRLRSGLLAVLQDGALRRQIVRRALAVAERNHDPATAGKTVRQILENAGKKPGRILQVNNVLDHRSTGKITEQIHRQLRQRGYVSTVVYGRGQNCGIPRSIRLCPEWYGKVQALLARFSGWEYGGCLLSTWRLRRILQREKPDVVHLQCSNGHFVNIYRLLEWLKAKQIPTVVSLHGEFLYTGGCAHGYNCEQWRHGCPNCDSVPRADKAWKRLARAFAGFGKNCVVCPVSEWIRGRAQQAEILKGLPMRTVYNPVDTQGLFSFRETKKEENGVLYVTAHFSPQKDHGKGGWYLLELAKRMPDVTFYVAGRADSVPQLPDNVKLLGEIRDQKTLADWYRRVKLTLLTSRRETFSMPCAESLCCGTPVVGFWAGGPEEITPPGCGEFVSFGNLEGLQLTVEKWLRTYCDSRAIAAEGKKRFGAAVIADALEQVYREVYGNEKR